MLASFGIPPEQHAETLVGIDKLDKIGTDGVRKELEARGVSAAAVAVCVLVLRGISEGAGRSVRWRSKHSSHKWGRTRLAR